MSEPPRIALYLPTFAGGGVERMNLMLMQFFADHGLAVTAIVHQAVGALSKQLPSNVELIDFGVARTRSALPKLVRWLRQTRPDLLFSSLGHNNIAALIARRMANVPTAVVISQHNALSFESADNATWQHRLLPLMYRLYGNRADAIVAVSHGVASDMSSVTGLPLASISVIHNAVISDDFPARMSEEITHPWLDDEGVKVFVAVGRLVPQKNFTGLLCAFNRMRTPHDARLLIIGEGPQHSKLLQLAHGLKLDHRVQLMGFLENPMPYIRKAAALVMSSRYEGFGNVLVESLACGTSIVSTDCPYGPAEILDDGRYGKLVQVGNSRQMAEAMQSILDVPFPEQLLRDRAKRFEVEVIGEEYLRLFESVLGRSLRPETTATAGGVG